MKLSLKLFAMFVLTGVMWAQGREPLPLPEPLPPAPAAKCGPWTCYHLQTIPTKDVFKSKAFWAINVGDWATQAFDAEMTHAGLAHHRCVEKNINPPYPSRADLYKAGWKEDIAVAGVAFIWVKVKGPKWVMPLFLTGPVVGHVFKGGLPWYENCW